MVRLGKENARKRIEYDYIHISVIQKKIEELNNSNGYSPVYKIIIEKVLNEILEEGRKLKRKNKEGN